MLVKRATTAAALGLRVHTGCAVAVILAGTRRAPRIVLRHEIDLADMWVPESRHPYHQELGNRVTNGEQARRRGCEAARAAARRVIRRLVDEMRSHGFAPHGAAVVVASLGEPARIGGAHARAHAEERRLYREAVAAALDSCGLRVATLLEKELRAVAASRLGRTSAEVAATLKAFSYVVGTPWRAPEKHAALAAWLALAR